MNLQFGLYQQQTMKLAMTQELKQAIELLQYSNQELLEFLESKAMENPFMQIESAQVKTMDPRYDRIKRVKNNTKTDKQSWLEQIAKKETSITEYLFLQMDFHSLKDPTKKILSFLANSLDENGYFSINPKDAASILKCTENEVEKAIKIIQGLEPAGIGARNLQECLLLQLERQEEKNKLALLIISDYFLPFAEKRWKIITKELNIELKEIQEVFDYIQLLNPRPASDFFQEPAQYIAPDLIIQKEGEEITVHFFDEALPQIRFNEKYFKQINSNEDEKVKRFLHEKQQDFQWIIKSIEQRKETLMKVALKIIEKQPDYFIYGPAQLKPMTMKEISEEIGIHESTVSRAVREKYVQTPYGTVELRTFFSSTIKTNSSEEASAVQVKKEITDLIQREDKTKPLSDQELVKILEKNSGILVSRRTIAKYRDQLGLPSSSKRKRFG